jgi:hypothetical protein
MLSDSQKEQFRKDGYAIVPGVLSSDDVARLRTFLADKFDSGEETAADSDRVLPNIFSRYEEVRFLLSHDKLIESLRSLLGENFVLFPISSAHDSHFGGWHKDTTSPERAGLRFHKEPDFLMAQVAIYLQDNDPEYGGGLTIVPGSHRESDPAAQTGKLVEAAERVNVSRVTTRLERWRTAASEKRRRLDERGFAIPSKAGDLVMFDFRCDHRATPATHNGNGARPEKRKFAIFMPSSTDNKHARTYKQYLVDSNQYPYLNNGDDYPQDVREAARDHHVTLV